MGQSEDISNNGPDDTTSEESSGLANLDFGGVVNPDFGGGASPGGAPDDLGADDDFLGDFDFDDDEDDDLGFSEGLGGMDGPEDEDDYDFGGPGFDYQSHDTVTDPPLLGRLGVEGDGGVDRIHVQRMTEEGWKQDLDYLPGIATMAALVKRAQGKPGIYLLTPCDEMGRALSTTARKVHIPSDHPAVIAYRRRKAEVGGGAMPGGSPMASSSFGSDPSVYLDYLQERDVDVNEKLDRAFAARDESSRFIVEQSAHLHGKAFDAFREQAQGVSRMQSDYFAKMAESDRAHMDRMIEAERERTKVTIDSQNNLLQMVLAMNERETSREAARREREERQNQELLKLQMMMLENQRQNDARLADRERAMANETLKMQMQMIQAQNPMNMMYALSSVVPGLAKGLGLEGKDVMGLAKTLLGADTGQEDSSISREIFETVRTGLQALPDIVQGMQGMGGAPPWADDDEDEDDWEEEEEESAGPMPPQQAPAPQQQTPQPGPGMMPEPPALPHHRVSDLGLGNLAAMAELSQRGERVRAEEAARLQEPQPHMRTPQPTQPQASSQDDAQDPAKATEWLVQQLSQTDSADDWRKLTVQVFRHLGQRWIDYLTRETIRGAARKAGASEQLINDFIELLDEYPQTASIPRG